MSEAHGTTKTCICDCFIEKHRTFDANTLKLLSIIHRHRRETHRVSSKMVLRAILTTARITTRSSKGGIVGKAPREKLSTSGRLRILRAGRIARHVLIRTLRLIGSFDGKILVRPSGKVGDVDSAHGEFALDTRPTAPLGETRAHERIGITPIVDQSARACAAHGTIGGAAVESVARKTLPCARRAQLPRRCEANDFGKRPALLLFFSAQKTVLLKKGGRVGAVPVNACHACRLSSPVENRCRMKATDPSQPLQRGRQGYRSTLRPRLLFRRADRD